MVSSVPDELGGAHHCTHDHRSHLIPRHGAALAIRTPAATRPESQLRHLLDKLEIYVRGGDVREVGSRGESKSRQIVCQHPCENHEYLHLPLCYRFVWTIKRGRSLASRRDS